MPSRAPSSGLAGPAWTASQTNQVHSASAPPRRVPLVARLGCVSVPRSDGPFRPPAGAGIGRSVSRRRRGGLVPGPHSPEDRLGGPVPVHLGAQTGVGRHNDRRFVDLHFSPSECEPSLRRVNRPKRSDREDKGKSLSKKGALALVKPDLTRRPRGPIGRRRLGSGFVQFPFPSRREGRGSTGDSSSGGTAPRLGRNRRLW